VRIILVRDDKPRTRDRDDRGYGLPLVTTDLESTRGRSGGPLRVPVLQQHIELILPVGLVDQVVAGVVE
jgi:hypothetical protein